MFQKKTSINIVKACVILHNIVRTHDGDLSDDDGIIHNDSQFQRLPILKTTTTGKTGRGVRSCFANYFMTKDGQLPWQLSKI